MDELATKADITNVAEEFYNELAEKDAVTAEDLRGKEVAINRNYVNVLASATEIGRLLFDAREKLANHNGGLYRKWLAAMGMKKDKAQDLTNRYELVVGISDDQRRKKVEALPLSMSYKIAKKSTPPELAEKVISGEIQTNKEFDQAKKAQQAEKLKPVKVEVEPVTLEQPYEQADEQAELSKVTPEVEELRAQLEQAEQRAEEEAAFRKQADREREQAEAQREQAEHSEAIATKRLESYEEAQPETPTTESDDLVQAIQDANTYIEAFFDNDDADEQLRKMDDTEAAMLREEISIMNNAIGQI